METGKIDEWKRGSGKERGEERERKKVEKIIHRLLEIWDEEAVAWDIGRRYRYLGKNSGESVISRPSDFEQSDSESLADAIYGEFSDVDADSVEAVRRMRESS